MGGAESVCGLVHIRVAEAGVQGWKTQGMGNGFAETGEMGWVGITKGIEELGLYSASSVGCSYISKGIPPYMNSSMEFKQQKNIQVALIWLKQERLQHIIYLKLRLFPTMELQETSTQNLGVPWNTVCKPQEDCGDCPVDVEETHLVRVLPLG